MPKHRPFFSIIIPCWNDGRYQEGKYLDRLLTSLTEQNVKKNDLEVILSDDHSPVPFDDVIQKFKSKLNIRYVLTDYNFAPGNTREKGVSIATGEWIAFADHDDAYYPGALGRIQQGLIEKGEDLFAFTDFDGIYPDGTFKKKYECTLNWCHGKFYNLDNFWKKYNIHFVKDLKSHEDIAICTQVSCTLAALGRTSATYFEFSSYMWTDNPESVSHIKYTANGEEEPRYFLEVFFKDYIASTGDIYLQRFADHQIKYAYAIKNCLEIICYCYFYTQSFMFRNGDNYLQENMNDAADYVSRVKKAFNISDEQIYNAIAASYADMYYRIRSYADGGCGRYIPQMTLKEWLEHCTRLAFFLNHRNTEQVD